MVKNIAGGCNGKKVARKHTTKSKNELRLSKSSDEKYAIVKKLLGNTCDVICDDGVNRRCIIRGKFTGRNKRDNMLDGGTFILVGMREWVEEGLGSNSRTNEDKNVRYCDLLEVYNSMERDILRRTHNIFSSLKDESGNKYDDIDNNVTFVDENTIKYQGMIKKMEGKKSVKGSGSGSGSGSSEEDDDEEELHVQATVITTNVKHVGKGVFVQSYEISDDDDDDDDDENNNDNENQNDRGYVQNFNKVTIDDNANTNTNTNTYATSNKNKKIVYEVEKNINVDDI
jgi:translation initiation factor IF-1